MGHWVWIDWGVSSCPCTKGSNGLGCGMCVGRYYGGESGFERVLDLLEDACEGLHESLNNTK